ncbi:MAG: hypothetical protein JXA21_03740 [Anaerolineae bacterium]|nr:hypothetical protein [Anaerolineae bacterium]
MFQDLERFPAVGRFEHPVVQQFDHFFQERCQIHGLRLDDRPPAEIQNLLNQRRGPPGLLQDDPQAFASL